MKEIVGVLDQWSDIRPSKWGSWNRGLKIGEQWYNFYSKDANYVTNLNMLFPAGTTVKLEVDDSKGYFPVKKIEKTTEQVQITLTTAPKEIGVRNGITKKILTQQEGLALIKKAVNQAIEELQAIVKTIEGV